MEVVGGKRPFSKAVSATLVSAAMRGSRDAFPALQELLLHPAQTQGMAFHLGVGAHGCQWHKSAATLALGMSFFVSISAGCHPTSVTLSLPMASYVCLWSSLILPRDLVLLGGTANLISLPNKPCFPLSQQHVAAPWLRLSPCIV